MVDFRSRMPWKNYLEGFGSGPDGPFLDKHIVDANSYWTWLNTSGAAGLVWDSGEQRWTGAVLPARHSLIGDARVTHIHGNMSNRQQWILSGDGGREWLSTNPGACHSAAVHVITDLYQTEPWSDADTHSIQIVFCTLNLRDQYLVLNNVTSIFKRPGILCGGRPPDGAGGRPCIVAIVALYLRMLRLSAARAAGQH